MRWFAPHRRMLPLGWHLLREDMCALVGAKGLLQGGALPGVQPGLSTLVVLERQALLHLLGPRLVGGGQGCELPLGDLPSGDPSRHLLGGPVAAVVLVRGVAVLREFDALCALPAPAVRGDGRILAGTRDLVVVGCHGEPCAHQPRGYRRGMASNTPGKSGRHLRLGRLTAIG
jgi:hypothetical protein